MPVAQVKNLPVAKSGKLLTEGIPSDALLYVAEATSVQFGESAIHLAVEGLEAHSLSLAEFITADLGIAGWAVHTVPLTAPPTQGVAELTGELARRIEHLSEGNSFSRPSVPRDMATLHRGVGLVALLLSAVGCTTVTVLDPAPEPVEVTARSWVEPGGAVRAEVLCPEGMNVIEGTCWISGYLTLTGEGPTVDPSDGWACTVTNDEDDVRIIEVTASCE